MKEYLKLEEKCPICDSYLRLDHGYPGSKEEESRPTIVYCPDCEYNREPSTKEILKILGI